MHCMFVVPAQAWVVAWLPWRQITFKSLRSLLMPKPNPPSRTLLLNMPLPSLHLKRQISLNILKAGKLYSCRLPLKGFGSSTSSIISTILPSSCWMTSIRAKATPSKDAKIKANWYNKTNIVLSSKYIANKIQGKEYT